MVCFSLGFATGRSADRIKVTICWNVDRRTENNNGLQGFDSSHFSLLGRRRRGNPTTMINEALQAGETILSPESIRG
jgi:hypothetical protein